MSIRTVVGKGGNGNMTACPMIRFSAVGGDGNITGAGTSRNIGRPDTPMAEIMGIEIREDTTVEMAKEMVGEMAKEMVEEMAEWMVGEMAKEMVEEMAEWMVGEMAKEMVEEMAKGVAEGRMSFLKNSG